MTLVDIKYDIGDLVFFLESNKIVSGTVEVICISNTKIDYKVKGLSKTQSEVFHSVDSLVSNLIGAVNEIPNRVN